MGSKPRFGIDVPLGWRPIGDDVYLVQGEPRATAQLGPVMALETLACAEAPEGARALVVGDVPLETRDGASLRLVVVNIFVAALLHERRWLAIFEQRGAAAVVVVRAFGRLHDLDELVEALRTGRLVDDGAATSSWLQFWCR